MAFATCDPTVLDTRPPLPVDAMISDPIFTSTHAIIIDASPEQVARLPHPLLIGFAAIGHRIMEARHLRGIQRRSTAASAGRDVNASWRKALLVCGILSSLLYGAMIGAIGSEGYSRISQTPSELTAIGAPTRSLWMLLGAVYTVLVTAFGWGVWKSAGRDRALRIVGGLLVAYGSLGLLWPFAPMHQREVLAAGGGTLSDTMHIVLASATVLLMFVAMGLQPAAFGKRFRLYSIASIVVLLAFGALTFWDAPRVQANLPTPWIGLWERINISVFLLWVVVLATVLLRGERAGQDRQGSDAMDDVKSKWSRSAVAPGRRRSHVSHTLRDPRTRGAVLVSDSTLDGPLGHHAV